MPTPSGQIAFSQVNAELGVSPTSSQANLGSAPFRGLAGVPSGQISMSNLQNKSSFTAISATGGTVSDSGGYRYHVYTAPGSLVVSNAGTPGAIEYIAIGGGGGGGNGGDSTASGGGAGGLVYNSSFIVTATTYPFTVGGGGGAAANGGNTTAFGITALGGGYGSSRAVNAGDGGCGGGASHYSGAPLPNSRGTGLQPSQNPGVANLTQYGNPGLPSGGDAQYGPGGSANASNDRNVNATFPNGSTILSGSPIGPQAIGRGGFSPGTQWPATSYGSGGQGTAQTGSPGIGGAIIVRYRLS